MKKIDNGQYAIKYSQIHSTSIRGALKHTALSGLANYYRLSSQFSKCLSKNRIQFLYMHHIFEDEKKPFRKLIQALIKSHNFISYSEAISRILTGNIDKPYIAVSFDDGFKNSMAAADIMDEYGIKACFFLCGSMIGQTSYSKIKEFCRLRLYKPPIEFLSWDEVEKLLHRGHEIGSHTMNHVELAKLSVEEGKQEIISSFELITRRIGYVKHFSWPLGRFFHFTSYMAKSVFEAGFESCSSAERGCHINQIAEGKSELLCIRRDLVVVKAPIDHTLYFMARSSRTASINNNQWPEGWREIIQGDLK